jgi:xanthine dehydrogenase accessory factor
MTIACFEKLSEILPERDAVLATVIHLRGSVPREVGARMLIFPDGSTFDTIGGGAGEAKVIRAAIALFKTGQKQQIEIDLTGTPQRETQGICGGIMQVWLERWSGEAAIALTRQILDHLKTGQSVTFVTPFTPDQSPYLSSPTTEPIPNAFVDTLEPPPTLLIIGAGHVGVQLAKLAHLIGFQVAVQDDRPEWANGDRYPHAMVLQEAIVSAVEHFKEYTQLYAALVTRGYQYDLEALQVLLKRDIPCRYIGMIGSQKRVNQVFQAAQEFGISPENLSGVYAPIGLEIGALTPEEIAISICAELVLVRRRGKSSVRKKPE